MKHLNYTHLLYFWTVVREGGVVAAARSLNLTPQTISGQLKLLEAQLQGALFEKQGRRLVPTELGRIAYAYAEEIFARGLELASVLRGARTVGRRPVSIGIADAVPKLLTWRILEPLLRANPRLVGLLGNLVGITPVLAEALARDPALFDVMLSPDAFAPLPDALQLAAELASLCNGLGLEERLDRVRRWTAEVRFQLGAQLIEGYV
jgi:DNA-binding transcriptional LysR family regulator